MSKNKKITVGVVLVAAILLVVIGYAAITAIPLSITGTATGTATQGNFKVVFSGTPTTSDSNKVTATVDSTNALKATINVKNLTKKGDSATATYTISNTSEDLTAALTTTQSITGTNADYFKVTPTLKATTVAKGSTTTLTVKVEMIKTPIDVNPTATVTVTVNAAPQQPAS